MRHAEHSMPYSLTQAVAWGLILYSFGTFESEGKTPEVRLRGPYDANYPPSRPRKGAFGQRFVRGGGG